MVEYGKALSEILRHNVSCHVEKLATVKELQEIFHNMWNHYAHVHEIYNIKTLEFHNLPELSLISFLGKSALPNKMLGL